MQWHRKGNLQINHRRPLNPLNNRNRPNRSHPNNLPNLLNNPSHPNNLPSRLNNPNLLSNPSRPNNLPSHPDSHQPNPPRYQPLKCLVYAALRGGCSARDEA